MTTVMTRKIMLWVSLGLNVLFALWLLRPHPQGRSPTPYGRFYLGPNFSDEWNEGRKLKDFLVSHQQKVIALSFWIDTESVKVDLDDSRFRFHASMSPTDPTDFEKSDGLLVASTDLPRRLGFLNIRREGKYLSITGSFSVSEIGQGRQGIATVAMLTPEP